MKRKKHIKKYMTSKTEIGIIQQKNYKFFYRKKINSDEDGYDLIKEYYKVPQKYTENKDYIIYEYIDDFMLKTINDYFYSSMNDFHFEQLLHDYDNALNNTICLIDEKNTKSSRFFAGRKSIVENELHLIKWKYIVVNEKKYNIQKIIKSTIKIISKPKKIYSYLTNGDPTDTNMTYTGFITDFENAGYNSILSEISIMFVSFFSHGSYFYPKYNRMAYPINKKILSIYSKFKQHVIYEIIDDTIYIKNYQFVIYQKNKDAIKEFLNIYLHNCNYNIFKSDFQYLKYYIIMRLFTPIQLSIMCEYDIIVIYLFIILIYENVNSLEELLDFINRLECKNGDI